MPWTLAELADICGGRVKGEPLHLIDGFAAADEAGPGKLAFVSSPAWLEKLSAGAAAIIPPFLEEKAKDTPAIVVEQPRLAFAQILAKTAAMNKPRVGVHPSAIVETDAGIDENASIGALAYIGKGSSIGSGTVIFPQVYLGDNVKIGKDSILYPHCYVGHDCIIGDRVILGPGVSIGFDGFGYQWDGEKHVKIRQLGIAVIEDDVEIGSLSAVDRAALGETRIGAGTKIDNLVMIGHNCKIGRNVIIVSQTGLSGRVTIEDGAILAGQAGVKEGVRIGKGAIVFGRAGVMKDVPPGKRVGGIPARSESEWLRGEVNINKIPELRRKIKELESRLEAVEKGSSGKSIMQSSDKGGEDDSRS